jgi:hypothetical protein
MASSIQLLRSNNPKERPFPGNLLDGQPAINTNAEEPGLFFKATDGSIVKIGPAAITSDGNPPNTGGTGQPGNTIGELWLDKSQPIPVLRVYDGVQWVDAGSGSGGSPGIVTLQRWVKTASGGETSVSGPDNSAQILSYTPGLEEVFLNGVLLTRGVDYTADSGISITSLAPLTNGDEVTVLGWTPFNVLGAIDGSNLIDGTVSQAKLSDGSVTDIKVASNAAISSSKLQFLQAGLGAQARSVEDHLRDYVNVKDFGATGLASDNATFSIQAALNTGKDVFLPDGVYTLSGTLTLTTDYQTAFGSGKNTVLVQTSEDVNTFRGNARTGVELKNFTIKPGKSTLKQNRGSVEFSSSFRITIRNLLFDYNLEQFDAPAIKFSGVSSINCSIIGNEFINAFDCSNLNFVNGNADISFENGAKGCLVSENKCVSGNVYGITFNQNTSLAPCEDNIITNNVIKGCTAYGILIYGGTSTQLLRRFIISNNKINDISGAAFITDPLDPLTPLYWFGGGIYLNGVRNCTVTSNNVTNTCINTLGSTLPMGGICGTHNDHTITGNTVELSKRRGIFFSSLPSSFPDLTDFIDSALVICGNTVKYCEEEAIFSYNAHRVNVSGNAVVGYEAGSPLSSTIGIRVDRVNDVSHTIYPSAVVTGNLISSTNFGASFGITGEVLFNSNTVKDCNFALSISTGSQYFQCSSNIITDIGTNAISIGAGISGNVSQNLFKQVSNFCVVSSSNLQFVDNIFESVGGRFTSNQFTQEVKVLSNTAIPDITYGRSLATGGTTSITGFSGGFPGNVYSLLAKHNVIIVNSSSLALEGGINFAMTPGNILTFLLDDEGKYREVSRNV